MELCEKFTFFHEKPAVFFYKGALYSVVVHLSCSSCLEADWKPL